MSIDYKRRCYKSSTFFWVGAEFPNIDKHLHCMSKGPFDIFFMGSNQTWMGAYFDHFIFVSHFITNGQNDEITKNHLQQGVERMNDL